MHLKLYVSKNFKKDFLIFKDMQGSGTSRTLCCMISQFVKGNIEIDIPTIRKILLTNKDEIRKLRELLKEFD